MSFDLKSSLKIQTHTPCSVPIETKIPRNHRCNVDNVAQKIEAQFSCDLRTHRSLQFLQFHFHFYTEGTTPSHLIYSRESSCCTPDTSTNPPAISQMRRNYFTGVIITGSWLHFAQKSLATYSGNVQDVLLIHRER